MQNLAEDYKLISYLMSISAAVEVLLIKFLL